MKLGKLVGYTGQTSVRTELVAGLTTFLTMSYILAVNPDILSQAGMSKEDSGREERFLHLEVDGTDIDTLFEPKVLTNIKYSGIQEFRKGYRIL